MTKELPKELIVLTRTHQLLSEAKTFEDFKSIRNKAEAAWMYARSAKLGLEIQIHAAELKLECERRAGAIITEIELSQGGRPSKKNRSQAATSLEDLGINKSQSSRWQDEARLPEEAYKEYVAACRAAGREPTSQGLVKRSRQFSGKEPTQGPHRRGKKTRQSKSRIIDSPSITAVSSFQVSDEEDALIADLQSHHKQLADMLAEYRGIGRLGRAKPAQRHYVGRLLDEMGEFLAELRAKRQGERETRGLDNR